jgi:C-terminal processing protease CtpA/Prc
MRQAPHCTVVGQPTFGSSGNPKPHDLPNGVTVFVPSWQALRPDGSCFEVEGLKPDVVVDVSPEALGVTDPILERALLLLRERR